MTEGHDAGPHGLISTDEAGLCAHANAAAARLLKADPAELTGRDVRELLQNVLKPEDIDRWRRAALEKRQANLGEHRAENGRRYSCRSFPAAGGATICLLDVTEKQQAFESVREERRQMDEFLTVLAHELRNPLAAACQAAAVLRASHEHRSDMLDSLERQLGHFARIVDDLVDVAKIARGCVELRNEKIDVAELVASAVTSVAELVARKRHRIETDVPPGLTLDGDSTRLLQTLINLLRNAASYTDPGGTIGIVARQAAGGVEIRIRDTGRGIEPERIPHLFEQHYGQLGRDEWQAGFGVGLGVVRKMVQLHGGTVTAESEGPGRGTEFTVWLPARH